MLTILPTILLIVSILATIQPVSASTGHPKLAVVDDPDTPTTITVATMDVSIPAGTWDVYEVNGIAIPPGYFAIVFYESGWLVTFSGAQFDLYMSQDGYSQLSTNDKEYAKGFSVADLESEPLKKVTVSHSALKGGKADFYIGKFDFGGKNYKILVGPIIFDDVTVNYKYIKIYDGTVTSVAVATQTIKILPSLELTPTEGPAGATVTLKGVALEPNKLVNLTYGANSAKDQVFAQVTTTSIGQLTYSWAIKDLKQEFENPGTTELDISYTNVNVYAWYNATGTKIAAHDLHKVTYKEYARAFWQLKSVKAGTIIGPGSTKYKGWGNATDPDYLVVNAYVFDTLIIAGVWWNPTSAVTLEVDSVSLGSITPDAKGTFNITLTVPELSMGQHIVKVSNAGVRYLFKLNVLPTLIISPKEGIVGTPVEAKVYGFPEKKLIGIYWFEKCMGENKWYNLVNGTTGADGKFNVTVTFKVPNAYGGTHDVSGGEGWPQPTATFATDTFNVKPNISVSPSTVENNGTKVTVTGTGLNPNLKYDLDIANQKNFLNVYSDCKGDGSWEFYSGGFQAGYNTIVLYNMDNYKYVARTSFTVLESSVILEKLDKIQQLVDSLKAYVNSTTTGLPSIKTLLTAVQDAVADAKSALSTQITGLSTQLTSIGSSAQDAATKATSASTSASSAATAAAAAKTAAEGAQSATATISTAVYGAIVLSLIAALASIVAVITLQKKVA